MGVGFKIGGSASFKSYVTVQANPSATITLTLGSVTYSAQANSNGVASFTVKKKGTYTVSTNNTASSNAEGNTSTIAVTKTNKSFSGQMVKINVPASLSAGNYSSNVLSLYWTRPSSNWTGCNLRWSSSSAPTSRTSGTSIATGAGSNITLTNSSTVNGYNHTGLTANSTYYYSIFSYLTINGTSYWATTYRSASGVARSYINTIVTITSTQTWSVPTGWRQIQIFGVGGGGGGAAGSYGGGGGGGYTKTSGAISVTPGASYTATVGAGGSAGSGGAGGTGGTSSVGSIFSVGGGGGGCNVSEYRNGRGTYRTGGNGGSGGGARPVTSDSSFQAGGGDGGSNGGAGEDMQYSNSPSYYYGGYGQGTTTRAWGSSSGTLYAGGGGGGGSSGHSPGSGGSGGGATGAQSGAAGSSAGNNTGGGGGGGHYGSYKTNGGKGGSGIILIKCVA